MFVGIMLELGAIYRLKLQYNFRHCRIQTILSVENTALKNIIAMSTQSTGKQRG